MRAAWGGGGGAEEVKRYVEGVEVDVCGRRVGRRVRRVDVSGAHSLFIVAQTKKTKKLRRHIICANRSSVKSLRM